MHDRGVKYWDEDYLKSGTIERVAGVYTVYNDYFYVKATYPVTATARCFMTYGAHRSRGKTSTGGYFHLRTGNVSTTGPGAQIRVSFQPISIENADDEVLDRPDWAAGANDLVSFYDVAPNTDYEFPIQEEFWPDIETSDIIRFRISLDNGLLPGEGVTLSLLPYETKFHAGSFGWITFLEKSAVPCTLGYAGG